MKIAIGSDHRGFAHKEFIKEHLGLSAEWVDVGTYDEERTDYPIYAEKVVQLIQNGAVSHALLFCASGGGMAVAANRHSGVYAVVAWNNEIAAQCKQEDNANVLVIPSDFVSGDDAIDMIQIWVTEQFKGGRYAERIAMIDKI